MSEIHPSIHPVHLVFACHVVLISAVVIVVFVDDSGHCCKVMCPSFRSIVRLCCYNHVRPIIALALPIFVTVNRICSVFTNCEF